ncbi:MAG: hypothetical protein D6806_17835 [Deltaproteobacteria bacterium]|nr:MAG: hypothetical protein D6806_17835 [Deltaproteobacteria bacterium]
MKLSRLIGVLVLGASLAIPAAAQDKKQDTGTEAAQKKAKPAVATDADKAAAQKAAMQMLTQGVDPSKAPEDVKKMAGHIEAIMTAIASNMPDCNKAAAAAGAYAKKHKAEIEALNAKFKALQESKSPKAMEYGRYMMAILLPKLMQMQQKMTQFSTNCAEQAKALKAIMEAAGGAK